MQEANHIPSYLIARYLAREASLEEQARLAEWVAENPEHQRIFLEYCEIWKHGGSVTSPEYRTTYNSTRALEKLVDRLPSEFPPSKRTTPKHWFVIAATLLIGMLFVGLWLTSTTVEEPAVRQWVTRTNPAGQKSTIRLPDGSVVKLNALSSIQFPSDFTDNRTIRLTGEAFFDVVHDSTRPFVVSTGSLHTRVLGTSFNIKASDEKVEVSVATGKVMVTDSLHQQHLLPHEKIEYDQSARIWTHAITDLTLELAWKNDALILRNKALADLIPELESWYGVQIRVDENTIKNCRITGEFINVPLETVLKALAYENGIHYQIQNKMVTLTGGCSQ